MSRLSPINQARWARFKSNRRGYWSLWIFLALFVVTLFSELIANDKPLLVKYDDKLYAPFIVNYSETTFGGQLDSRADFRDPYIAQRIDSHGWALWPLIRYNYDSINFATTVSFPSPPSWQNLLGTDSQGKDVVAQVMYGFRISMLFGLALTILSSLIGITVGATQGYYGGRLDLWGQRFIEVWSGMPTLFLIILLSSVIQPDFWWLLGITVLFGWMSLVGVVRAEFLRTRNFDYIRAAQAMGVSDRMIMYRCMLPNAMVATLTYLPFILCGSITTLTSLDFLGFGLPMGSPSLGTLLLEGKNNLQAPWLGITVFMVLSVVLSLLIFIGEAVRDAFDPSKAH
ncbi:ABC transporter permease [Brenneria tiliae]|uniref:ABC transporter permease n=1 Tax=Brenneria tiliae TaxID=2914984 RepID=UPI002014EFA8|nr:microcin C ABC transporter permease [Brenneria tiliae]MCL2899864.1 microcin C ABC transporter permease [Brenneria tiliae]MCL2904647.1 microcin C ABC transporter permease [Brenneria tiliae]